MSRAISVTALVACCLASLGGPAGAQIPVDIVAGPTIATVSTDAYDTSSKVGFFVAAGTAFPLSETLFVSPYVGYVQKGTEFDDGTNGSYDYIEIPVFLGTQIPLNERWALGISAGPQVAFNVSCDEDGYDCSQYEDFKGTEFGIVGGVGLGVPISEAHVLSFGGTYDFGLTDIFSSEDDFSYKNRVLYLWVSFGSMIGG
jgi:hypothetical protein